MFDIPGTITAVADLGGKIIDKIFPDPNIANQAKLKLFEMQNSGELAQLAASTDLQKAAMSVIETEAKSESWLTRSWRPITMLVFVALITARMLGLTSAHVTEAEYLKLWDLIELGLGGYVIGRSGLQIAKAVVPALSGK